MKKIFNKTFCAMANPKRTARRLAFTINYTPKFVEKRNKLKKSFEQFCYIDNPRKLSIAQDLIRQQGSVDADIEGFKDTQNQRDLSIMFHWGHNHRFNSDLSIDGRMGNRHINLISEFMTGFGLSDGFFEGKDCIDVGSWTGGTTLMLKHLGANKVLALEEVKKYSKTTLTLCRDVYELENVTSEGTNLYDLKCDSHSYQVAYFPGVIYHLSDPVLGLRRLFNCLDNSGVCLVETAGIDENRSIAIFDGNRIYHNTAGETEEKLNRGGWNWYIPSPLCLYRWMVEAGFDNVKTYYSYTSNRVFGYGERKKYVNICRAGFSVPSID